MTMVVKTDRIYPGSTPMLLPLCAEILSVIYHGGNIYLMYTYPQDTASAHTHRMFTVSKQYLNDSQYQYETLVEQDDMKTYQFIGAVAGNELGNRPVLYAVWEAISPQSESTF